jgi:hypothetical protein
MATESHVSFHNLLSYLYEYKRTTRSKKVAQEAVLLTRPQRVSDVNESWPWFSLVSPGKFLIRPRSLPYRSSQINFY